MTLATIVLVRVIYSFELYGSKYKKLAQLSNKFEIKPFEESNTGLIQAMIIIFIHI